MLSRERLLIVAKLIGWVVVAVILADHVLRISSLAGNRLQSLLFFGLTKGFCYVDMFKGEPAILAGLLVIVGCAAFFLKKSLPVILRAYLIVIVLLVFICEGIVIFFAAGMEKAAFTSLAAMAVTLTLIRPDPSENTNIRSPTLLGVTIVAVLLSVYFSFKILNTEPAGYKLSALLTRLWGTADEVPGWRMSFYFGLLAIGAGWAGILFSRNSTLPWHRLGLTTAVGLAGFGVGALLSRESSFWITAICVVPVAALVGTVISTRGQKVLFDLRTLPGGNVLGMTWLVFFCFVLIAHTFTFRVFGSDASGGSPFLQRLGTMPETFRLTTDPDDKLLAFVWRGESQIAVAPIQTPWATQPINANMIADESDNFRIAGIPEDLLCPEWSSHCFSTVIPNRSKYPSSRNVIVEVDLEKRETVSVHKIEDLCWVNRLSARTDKATIVIGCENVPELIEYDPVARKVLHRQNHEEMGDLHDVVFLPENPSLLYGVPLWYGDDLIALDLNRRLLNNKLRIGPGNYQMVLDEKRNRVFISNFYSSRVTVVDIENWKQLPSLPTGFGSRALAVDMGFRLLLASGMYDGRLWLYDLDSLEPIGSVQTGGHVKDIVTIEGERRAYFVSRTGFFSLDYGKWVDSMRKTQ